ncbi:hypothetical protein SAMN05216570_0232 [Dyella sp. OK004]|uniref:hypothetical protein n=1 Tax=Dyella sp. OK004 TaxID=1855292 RepID=UPI0008E0F515|nr:hypothetical protein [Dyella sp. OK004]SFR87811.1 hypothetical protein SAMN05216570_0232 [Dyella sp. OK004]
MAKVQGGPASQRFRRRIVAAWAVALGLHAALLLVMLRPGQGGLVASPRALNGEDRLRVRMLAANPLVQAPPAIVMPAPARIGIRSTTPSTAKVATSAPSGVTANQSEGSASPALQLRNVDGSIHLPAKSAQTRDTGIADMRHFQGQPCRGTRFARSYSRAQDETLGAEVARKYLSWIGLYNPLKEQQYRERREWHDRACAP